MRWLNTMASTLNEFYGTGKTLASSDHTILIGNQHSSITQCQCVPTRQGNVRAQTTMQWAAFFTTFIGGIVQFHGCYQPMIWQFFQQNKFLSNWELRFILSSANFYEAKLVSAHQSLMKTLLITVLTTWVPWIKSGDLCNWTLFWDALCS